MEVLIEKSYIAVLNILQTIFLLFVKSFLYIEKNTRTLSPAKNESCIRRNNFLSKFLPSRFTLLEEVGDEALEALTQIVVQWKPEPVNHIGIWLPTHV